MGSGSRSGASAHLWSMLLGEVRERRLHHLSCLASSAILFTSTLCYCGTAGKQLPRQSVGVCVTWPREANFHPSPSSSFFMLFIWLSWLVNGAARAENLLVISHFPHHNDCYVPTCVFFSIVQFLCVMEKWSAYFFLGPNPSEYLFPSCYLTPHV